MFSLTHDSKIRLSCQEEIYFCFLAFSLQIPWVMVPMGQKVHQVLGLKSPITTNPKSSEVNIRL